MDKQDLFIVVQFNGIKRRIQMLDTQPDAAQYEQVIPLPATYANNILYETILYVDVMDINEYEAKQLIVDIPGSPIWRAKMPGIVHPMPHDPFWNIILFINQQQDYTVLNANNDHETPVIESRAGGQPAFLAIDRRAYPQKAARKIYETSGYTFSELSTANRESYQAEIGMTRAVTLSTDIVAGSIACHLHGLRQAETSNP